MRLGDPVRYHSHPWAQKAGATREWVLEVVEVGGDVPGHIGEGQVIPDELLSIAGLGLDLTPEQCRVLSREEVASIIQSEIRFEAVLEAGFASQLATAPDVTAPRLTFILHEMGDETHHQLLFQRVVSQLEPSAKTPVPFRFIQLAYRTIIRVAAGRPAFLFALVLAGEEIPDLFQEVTSAHADTDPFIRDVYRHHRMEEANHVSFARAVYAEMWSDSTWVDRVLVRRAAPYVIGALFDAMVHPGVYRVVGLPPFRTWLMANRSPDRIQLRREATRPVVSGLIEAGALRPGRIPPSWRRLCGVDRHGRPSPDLRRPWRPRREPDAG